MFPFTHVMLDFDFGVHLTRNETSVLNGRMSVILLEVFPPSAVRHTQNVVAARSLLDFVAQTKVCSAVPHVVPAFSSCSVYAIIKYHFCATIFSISKLICRI
jgi:hypothetical protein